MKLDNKELLTKEEVNIMKAGCIHDCNVCEESSYEVASICFMIFNNKTFIYKNGII